MNGKKILAALLVIICGVSFAYAVFIEPRRLQINEYPIYFKNLPPEFHGYKILVISDLHYGPLMTAERVENVIRTANMAGADAIVGLGDYVRRRNSSTDLRLIWSMLKKLKAPGGVYCVNGNHDHWSAGPLSLRLLNESGFSVRHTSAIIQKGKSAIALAGAGDYYEDTSGLDEALKDLPSSMFRIALAHNPDTTDLPRRERVDLFLCGHTHGGQVRLPLIDMAIILPVDNWHYDTGTKITARDEKIFISRGIGWAIMPVRFNCVPEIAMVRLLKEAL